MWRHASMTDHTRKFRNKNDEFYFDTLKIFAKKEQESEGAGKHKGTHMIRTSTHWGGEAVIETVRKLGGGKDIQTLIQQREGVLESAGGPLAQAGTIEEKVFIGIEIPTDNPAKMHSLVAKLAKILMDEGRPALWRTLVEVPARSKEEFLGKLAAKVGPGFKSVEVSKERARGVLEGSGGPL